MIDFLLFIPACFALNMAFGPNNLLALTNGAQHGVAFAVVASFGRLLVFVPMIIVSALGLGIILSTSALVFMVVKYVGAAYLIWLGIKILRSARAEAPSASDGQTQSLVSAARREALVAIGNPKAILIFAAFFPQFVSTDAYFQSYAILGIIFLGLEAVAITMYAAGGAVTAKTAINKLHWLQGASGIGMMMFGTLLLFAKRPE